MIALVSHAKNMTHDKFESLNRSIRTSKGERKIFLSPRIIVVIIIESHLIIRLSAALVSVWATRVETVGTDVDFSNPWHAGRYGVIVTQRGGAPLLFPPSFPRQGIYSRAGREGLRGAF